MLMVSFRNTHNTQRDLEHADGSSTCFNCLAVSSSTPVLAKHRLSSLLLILMNIEPCPLAWITHIIIKQQATLIVESASGERCPFLRSYLYGEDDGISILLTRTRTDCVRMVFGAEFFI